MAVNFNKEKAYSNIVKKLIEKLPKEADKKFVSDNINVITKNLVIFSDYVRKILDISVEKIPLSSKIKKVTETKIFNSNLKLDEAREIINKLYQEFNNKFQIGGSPEEDNVDKEFMILKPLIRSSGYKSGKLTSLHKNNETHQKFPAINMVRQVLKCNGFKLTPYVVSIGYDQDTGKKLTKRYFNIHKIENDE